MLSSESAFFAIVVGYRNEVNFVIDGYSLEGPAVIAHHLSILSHDDADAQELPALFYRPV